MSFTEVTIEEFEQGAWIADLVGFEQFTGSFDIMGDTWTGTKVSERLEKELYHTRVIGGAGNLTKVVQDKYYNGQVSLQVAAGDICREAGETFGTAQNGAFLAPFERLRGPASSALDALANVFGAIWWVDRAGAVQMQISRSSTAAPDGVRETETADVDASVELVQPSGVELGATYDGKPIRHVRWRLTKDRFSARVFFVPFLFRPPTNNAYSCLYSARVDKDNGDGTIDVIVAGRFGVTSVPLFSGVPHSKVKLDGGDLVTLGFLGGDPQQPFCVAMGQDQTVSPTKKAARNGDSVQVTIPAGTVITSVVPAAGPGVSGGTGVPNPSDITLTGQITSGTARLTIGDA